MKNLLTNLLFVSGILLGAVATSNAAPLLEYAGWTHVPGSSANNENEPLATVTVGHSDVQIGSFGVYGRAQSTTNIAWVIFDQSDLLNPVFLSPIQQVSATANSTWYDAPGMTATLLPRHTYFMGVVADTILGNGGFLWHSGTALMGPDPTVGDGLTLHSSTAVARVGFCNGGHSAQVCGPLPLQTQTVTSFLEGSYPYISEVQAFSNKKMSLRINLGPDSPPPVPEPSEWAMLVAGLAVVGLIARRRRQR